MNEIADFSANAVDIIISEVVTNEVIKSIPIASSILKAIEAVKNIRDTIFVKKISKFLNEFNEISEKKKIDLIKLLKEDGNADEKRRIGETLICILDKCSDFDKPIFIAKVFAAYLQKKITCTQFARLCDAIDNATSVDLYVFGYEKDMRLKKDLQQTLLKNGFTENHAGTASGSMVTLHIRTSELGQLFIKCCEE